VAEKSLRSHRRRRQIGDLKIMRAPEESPGQQREGDRGVFGRLLDVMYMEGSNSFYSAPPRGRELRPDSKLPPAAEAGPRPRGRNRQETGISNVPVTSFVGLHNVS
jgi:hypothetical protein